MTGTSALAGLAAASVPILAPGQGRVTPQEQNYPAKECANLEAIKSYFDGLKTKDVSRNQHPYYKLPQPRTMLGASPPGRRTATLLWLVPLKVANLTLLGTLDCLRFLGTALQDLGR